MKKTTIEIRIGATAFGSVLRVVREGRHHTAAINGERVVVQDPHDACFVRVLRAPRDMNTDGYG